MSSTEPTAVADPGPVADVAGQPVALHFGSPDAEDRALHAGAALIDRSHRGRMRFRGPRAAEMLTGLVTNDVAGLAPGHGVYAAALTPKGKIVADVRVFALAAAPGGDDGATPVDALLVDAPARAWAGWTEVVRKYVNPRLAAYADESAATRLLGVYGPLAHHAVAEALSLHAAALAALPPYAQLATSGDGPALLVVRSPDLGAIEGFDVVVPAEAAADVSVRLTRAGAAPAGLLAWDIARVEAGRPEWGIDIDDATIPQEANLDELHAISYTKGCYTGQETVARVHFRGHVNRHLRGLRLESDADLPPARTPLVDAAGKPVGDVRSAVLSPRHGPIALAMVRREATLGDTVTVRWEGGETTARVSALPFE